MPSSVDCRKNVIIVTFQVLSFLNFLLYVQMGYMSITLLYIKNYGQNLPKLMYIGLLVHVLNQLNEVKKMFWMPNRKVWMS